MENHIENAIQYVRDNKTWSDAEEELAMEKINHMRCDINAASDKIACEIADLMNEYGSNNSLPENYWWQYESIDSIFFKL